MQVTHQLTELKQRHHQDERCFAKMQANLAVTERERSLLAEHLTRTELQLTELTTEKQVILQENAGDLQSTGGVPTAEAEPANGTLRPWVSIQQGL